MQFYLFLQFSDKNVGPVVLYSVNFAVRYFGAIIMSVAADTT